MLLYPDTKPDSLSAGCKGDTRKRFHATSEILRTRSEGDGGTLVLFNACPILKQFGQLTTKGKKLSLNTVGFILQTLSNKTSWPINKTAK